MHPTSLVTPSIRAGGSSGWQAPEQLIVRDGGVVRQTRAMDVFSLGCVLYYCITGGHNRVRWVRRWVSITPVHRDTSVFRTYTFCRYTLAGPLAELSWLSGPTPAVTLLHPCR